MKKISVPRVLCELKKWQLLPDKAVTGEIFNLREAEPLFEEGDKRSFRFTDVAHYPNGPDNEGEYFLFRLRLGDYVKCFIKERAEWPEALKALFQKPVGYTDT